jgi:hypothetical protein
MNGNFLFIHFGNNLSSRFLPISVTATNKSSDDQEKDQVITADKRSSSGHRKFLGMHHWRKRVPDNSAPALTATLSYQPIITTRLRSYSVRLAAIHHRHKKRQQQEMLSSKDNSSTAAKKPVKEQLGRY